MRKTVVFWVFNLSLALFGLYMTALTFNLASIFAYAGMGRDVAFGIFLPAACISVPLQILFSWWSDYTELRYLLIIMLAGMVISLCCLWFLAPGWTYAGLIVGNGLMGSTFGLLMSVTWPRLFGLKHLGAVSGLCMGWVVAGSALGPYLFSLSESVFGSYRAGILVVLAAALALTAMAPRARALQEG